MRSSVRKIFLISFVACHAIVLSAGPSLHGLLGLDHRPVGLAVPDSSDHPGGPRHALEGSSHDCAACHLLTLASHKPDSAVAFSFLQTGRVQRPIRVTPPPLEVLSDSPSRAPPLSPPGDRTTA